MIDIAKVSPRPARRAVEGMKQHVEQPAAQAIFGRRISEVW
jgi:hypothetical protein